uniref:Fam-b protein n=1 Tax=Parastrongyloides trichosuri TaxID=131310 RepID=A0A0N5A1J1_PARTI
MIGVGFKFFISTVILCIFVFGDEISYRYHYMDGRSCEIKNGQLIENGLSRDLTTFEANKLKKYENDIVKYNEFKFNHPLRSLDDLINLRFNWEKPQIPCFCSFCDDKVDNSKEQIVTVDWEKPEFKRRSSSSHEYEDSFPTPGSLFPTETNNNSKNDDDNEVTEIIDLRSTWGNQLCIAEDDYIVESGVKRYYTEEEKHKLEEYDNEVQNTLSDLREKVLKTFTNGIIKRDIHEYLIHMIKDHSKMMPEFPCLCKSCKDDIKIEEKDEPTLIVDNETKNESKEKPEDKSAKLEEKIEDESEELSKKTKEISSSLSSSEEKIETTTKEKGTTTPRLSKNIPDESSKEHFA